MAHGLKKDKDIIAYQVHGQSDRIAWMHVLSGYGL